MSDYPSVSYYADGPPPYVIAEDHITFTCFPFLHIAMSNVFEEWVYLFDIGIVMYVPDPSPTIEVSMRKFFGLSNKQFLHCCVAYMQFPQYGGKQLHRGSRPKDVAFNICALLSSVSPFAKRMVLEEKNCWNLSSSKTIF